MSSPILSIVFFVTLVNGLAFNSPRQTSAAEGNTPDLGWSPRPTPAPGLRHELIRREQAVITRSWVDNTCGYVGSIGGTAIDPYLQTCREDFLCIFDTATTSGATGHVKCLGSIQSTDIVEYATTCFDSAELSDDSCGPLCDVDRLALKCTYSDYPYCNYQTFPGRNFEFWSCGDTSYPGVLEIFTTYIGEDMTEEGRFWTTVELTYEKNDIPTSSLEPDPLALDTSSSLSSMTTSSTSTNQTASLPAAINSDTALPNGKSSQKSSPPVGAIVGGVIGGLGLLALTALGFFFIRKKYYNKSSSASQTPLTTYGASETSESGGKFEMEANEAIHPRNSTSEPKLDASYPQYKAYQPIPTEPPYQDNASLRPVSELTRGESTARHSVLSANWLPSSPTSTYVSVMPSTIAEVQGSEVPAEAPTPSIVVETPMSPKEVADTEIESEGHRHGTT